LYCSWLWFDQLGRRQHMQSLYTTIQTFEGQVCGALLFAVFWTVFIEAINFPLARYVRNAEWWSRALPNQLHIMKNFGYPKDGTTDEMALKAYNWVITMCITHIVSASLMIPVVIWGWHDAGESGRLLFFIGTMSEVGFDIYDWSKTFLLTFFHRYVAFLGPPTPVQVFVLICGFHHTTVLCMVMPMNLKYAFLPAYHRIGFSLLVSAGICYLSGQYKFTVDATTPKGLQTCKSIVFVQLVLNLLTRVIIWFPAAYSVLRTFFQSGDWPFFYGGCFGMLGMSLYNIVIALDASSAAKKWLPKKVKV